MHVAQRTDGVKKIFRVNPNKGHYLGVFITKCEMVTTFLGFIDKKVASFIKGA